MASMRPRSKRMNAPGNAVRDATLRFIHLEQGRMSEGRAKPPEARRVIGMFLAGREPDTVLDRFA